MIEGIIWLAALVASAIVSVECLDYSFRIVKKGMKNFYLSVAVITALVAIEALIKLLGITFGIGRIQLLFIVILRIIEFFIGIIGLCMVLLISSERQ